MGGGDLTQDGAVIASAMTLMWALFCVSAASLLGCGCGSRGSPPVDDGSPFAGGVPEEDSAADPPLLLAGVEEEQVLLLGTESLCEPDSREARTPRVSFRRQSTRPAAYPQRALIWMPTSSRVWTSSSSSSRTLRTPSGVRFPESSACCSAVIPSRSRRAMSWRIGQKFA